ncbi:hypothetical protein [Acinetobacter sp.]|uniref:hypothetical protein n=1 Tax=Acinetobacter sp. TaxID=472 RepID=UPI0037531378
MRIIIELTEQQAKVFQETLETTLQALVFQEIQIKDAIDNAELPHEIGDESKKWDQEMRNLTAFLAKISPQRVLIAEILHTVNQADKKTKITTDLSNMPKGLRGESLFE